MFEDLLSAVGDFFSSDTLGKITAAAIPSAITAFAGGSVAGQNADLEREKMQIQLSEAQKDRDLRLLLQKLGGGGGGGGGSGAAMLSAKGQILNNVVEQMLAQGKIQSETINQGTQNTMAPLLARYQSGKVV